MAELDLTAEQKAAIHATGHTLLVANAGTGKTTTIVRKVLWLLGHDIGTVAAPVAKRFLSNLSGD